MTEEPITPDPTPTPQKRKRRIIYKSSYTTPITKTWILRKIIYKIICKPNSPDFVFDRKKAKLHGLHNKILLPCFTRKSQEWNYYYLHTNSPYNIRFFMYSQKMLSEINEHHVSKFNALGLYLNFLQKLFGKNFKTAKEFTNLMDYVCKMQKYYWTLRRFVMHCQYKRAKVQIDHDLYMNPLSTKDKNTFALLQEGKLYYFTLTNLSNIIVNALTHHSMFFMQPQIVKNPYNNVELKISDLYNIYFKMRDSNYPIHPIFSRFFEMNFDINMFKMKHEYDLKNYAIKSYADNATTGELVRYALDMVYTVDTNKVWEFHEDFSDEIIVRELRPFIKVYLFYYYFPEYRQLYLKNLEERLQPVIKMNPDFGKKKESISRFSGTVQFYDNLYIPHPKHIKHDFLKSHKYEERGFNRMFVELNRQNTYRANYDRWRLQRSTPIVWMVSREVDAGYLSDEDIIVRNNSTDSDNESTDSNSDMETATLVDSDYESETDNDSHDDTIIIWSRQDTDTDEDEDQTQDTWQDSEGTGE
jgi:hypothetical protein